MPLSFPIPYFFFLLLSTCVVALAWCVGWCVCVRKRENLRIPYGPIKNPTPNIWGLSFLLNYSYPKSLLSSYVRDWSARILPSVAASNNLIFRTQFQLSLKHPQTSELEELASGKCERHTWTQAVNSPDPASSHPRKGMYLPVSSSGRWGRGGT